MEQLHVSNKTFGGLPLLPCSRRIALPCTRPRRSASTNSAAAARPHRQRVMPMAALGDDSTQITATGLPRAAVVGVLGGGQLGKMLAQEAVSCCRCWPLDLLVEGR